MTQFISVHIRRADFKSWCNTTLPLSECFAPVSAYARRVKEVQAELLLRKGIAVDDTHVIVMSDETDSAWWTQVTALGWRTPDHAQTAQTYGGW